MNIHPSQHVLSAIIRAAQTHPKGWHAAFGQDPHRSSTDCYIFHPDVGIYFLKEYTKNPYETLGVGAKLARHIDDDILDTIHNGTGGFGILQGNLQEILTNLHNGITPHEIIEGAVAGRDLGLRLPVSGQASRDPQPFTQLDQRYQTAKKKLLASYDRLAADEGLYRSYD